MRNVSRLFIEFFQGEKTGGLLLVLCAVASVLISNSGLGGYYVGLWYHHFDLSFFSIDLNYSIARWINDGLMTIFFLLVGLEIERELYRGELAGIKNAALPVVAAFGGMVVPALIHFLWNSGTTTQSGFGIPMATDIAFALGALSLAGKRVPVSLKILLTALAIIDDLGAILIIAFFYAHEFFVLPFGVAMIVFVALLVLNRLNVNNLFCYLAGGVLMWLFMLHSGIHPSISGVLLAFAIPFREGDSRSPSYKMQHYLDKPVPFFVLPLFALANTAIIFPSGWYLGFHDSNTAGIVTGLVLGKPLGILLFSFIAIICGLCKLPRDLTWRHVAGMGILAGIGFTMSIFIANLAFDSEILVENSKIAILCASAIAGIGGLFFLFSMRQPSSSSAD